MFTDLPGIDFSESDLRQQHIFGEEPDPSWWQLKSPGIPFRFPDNDLDGFPYPPNNPLMASKPMSPSVQELSNTFDPFATWPEDYSKTHARFHSLSSQSEALNPVPYNYAIPRGVSPEGWWVGGRPAIEQDSCSSSIPWSPRTSEGLLEPDPGFSSRASSWSDYPENPPCLPHMPSELSGNGPYPSAISPTGIAPCVVQFYPDIDAEETSSKPQVLGKIDRPPYYMDPVELGEHVHYVQENNSSLCEDEDECHIEDDFEEDNSRDDDDYVTPGSKRLGRRINLRNLAASSPSKRSSRGLKPPSPTLTKSAKIAKSTKYASSSKPLAPSPTSPVSSKGGKSSCGECSITFPSPSALHKHNLSSHIRPFTCSFRRYGCDSTFGSKNEWKRHVSSQHLRLGIWRCDIDTCVPTQPRRNGSSPSSGGNLRSSRGDRFADTSKITTGHNEFNRKDLFTQHVRRMHGPPVSATLAEKTAFDNSLEEMRERCWVQLRRPPPRSTCGFCRCKGRKDNAGQSQQEQGQQQQQQLGDQSADGQQQMIFEGDGAWDDRMEHVGRHLENGDTEEKEDDGLRDWMVAERLLGKEKDLWRVVGCGSRRLSPKKLSGDKAAANTNEKGDDAVESWGDFGVGD